MRITARGWSNESLDAARRQAIETAQKVAIWIASGKAERRHYLYGERPLPEPVIREFSKDAVVTRNAYGALVLNTSRLMFIDVDHPEEAPSAPGASGFLSSLFGKKAPEPPRRTTPLDRIIDATQRNGLHGRVYQTAAGFRVIIDSREFEPGSAGAESILKDFGSDPLYVRLCRMQESFRARLTPKPWRCQTYKPPATFPFETPQVENRYAQWISLYEAKSQNFATCRYLQDVGSVAGGLTPEVIAFHDEQTRAGSSLPLA